MSEDPIGAKAASFLASLRGPEEAPPPATQILTAGGDARPPDSTAPPAAPDLRHQELLDRLAEMESRLQEVAKAALPPSEGEPPRPPTELMLFLQTKMELLEGKLQAAQEEALRANLLLRERDEAQKEARREVENLFKTMREQSRAAAFDAELRRGYASAQEKIAELETKLQDLRAKVPEDELARLWRGEEGRAELQRRIEEQGAQAAQPAPPPLMAEPPAPPTAPPAPPPSDPTEDDLRRTVAVLTGRIADLETRLEEAHKEKDREKARRVLWEKDIFTAVSQYGEAWRRSGGAQVIVESALQNIVQIYRERDALAAEMAGLVDRIQDSPPDAPGLPELRSSLNEAQGRMRRLQETIDRHMSIVQAWIQENRPRD